MVKSTMPLGLRAAPAGAAAADGLFARVGAVAADAGGVDAADHAAVIPQADRETVARIRVEGEVCDRNHALGRVGRRVGAAVAVLPRILGIGAAQPAGDRMPSVANWSAERSIVARLDSEQPAAVGA